MTACMYHTTDRGSYPSLNNLASTGTVGSTAIRHFAAQEQQAAKASIIRSLLHMKQLLRLSGGSALLLSKRAQVPHQKLLLEARCYMVPHKAVFSSLQCCL